MSAQGNAASRGATDPSNPAGLQPQQYEAALALWDAHDALVPHINAKGSDFNERSDKGYLNSSTRMDFLVSVYLEWSRVLMRRYILQPNVVVGRIDDSDPALRLTNDSQRDVLSPAHPALDAETGGRPRGPAGRRHS